MTPALHSLSHAAREQIQRDGLEVYLRTARRNLIQAMKAADALGESTLHFHLTQAAACLDNAEGR